MDFVEIGSTYSYAPLATVSEAGLAQFATETAVTVGAETASVSAGSSVSALLAFFGSAALGVAVSTLSADRQNNEENEIFYRVMSNAEYLGLGPKGEIAIGQTENFVSQSPEYVIQLALRHPDSYQKLVVYVMEAGTRNALVSKGAISNGAQNIDPSLGGLPNISDFPRQYPNIVHIKGETGNVVNFGLRRGTVDVFNSRIRSSVATNL